MRVEPKCAMKIAPKIRPDSERQAKAGVRSLTTCPNPARNYTAPASNFRDLPMPLLQGANPLGAPQVLGNTKGSHVCL